MSNGGGQAVVFTIPAYPNFKLYHYAAGTTTLKNIYSDEDLQTTAAQPMVADANGVIQFYALGNFKFKIDDANDVNRYTWDNYNCSKGQPLISDYAVSLPAALPANKGHLFATITAGGVLTSLSINASGSAWVPIYSATGGGQTLDSIITKTLPVYNVKHADWGALGDGATDDTAAVQLAIDAIVIAGNGILYFPTGIYVINGTLDIDNTDIFILGDGSGLTVLKQKTDPGTPMIDYDTDTVSDMLIIKGIGFETELASAFGAVNHFAPSTSGTAATRNIIIEDVTFGPTTAQIGTAYFDDCLIVSDAKRGIFNNIVYVGKNGASSENGITFNGYSVNNHVRDSIFKNIQTRYTMHANSSNNRFNDFEEPFVTLASATSVALSQYSNNYYITGTTDIDNITGFYEGRKIRFLFEDSLLVRQGGNIITPSSSVGANAGDVLELIYNETAALWYVSSWSDN